MKPYKENLVNNNRLQEKGGKVIIFFFMYDIINLLFSFVAGGVLPGGYNYLHISKPEIPIHLDLEPGVCDHVSSII